jgi:hypothetical protein
MSAHQSRRLHTSRRITNLYNPYYSEADEADKVQRMSTPHTAIYSGAVNSYLYVPNRQTGN